MKKLSIAKLHQISQQITADGAWIAVVIALISGQVVYLMNSFRSQYQEILSEYRHALDTSKQQLVETYWFLSSDSKLRISAVENQQHSLKQTLSTFLGYGKTDGIILFNDDCRLLANSAIKAGKNLECNKEESGFRWVNEGQNNPVLVLQQKFQLEERTSFFILMHVRLDNDWLKQFPRLNFLFDKYQMRLHLNYLEPRIQSKNLVFKYFSDLVEQPHEVENLFFWPFVCLALFFLGVKGIGRQQKWQRKQDLLNKFEIWCQNFSLPFAEQKFTIDSNQDLANYFSRIVKILEKKANSVVFKLTENEKKLNHILKENANLYSELKQMRDKFIDGIGHESLALQVQQIALPLSEKLYNADDQLHVVLQLLQKQLLVHSNSLFALILEWKKGISKKGPRKFIRSLYESVNDNSDKDLLSTYLESFLLYSGKIGDVAIQCCLQMKKIQPNYALSAKVLAKWYSLALNDRLDLNKKAMILDSLKTVKGMLEGAGIIVRWQLTHPQSLISEMPLPEGVLVSVLYHILYAFLQNNETGPVVIEMKREGSRRWLYFWHPNLDSSEWQRSSKILSLVRHMIEGYGLTIQHLSQHKGQMLFVSWNDERMFSSKIAPVALNN